MELDSPSEGRKMEVWVCDSGYSESRIVFAAAMKLFPTVSTFVTVVEEDELLASSVSISVSEILRIRNQVGSKICCHLSRSLIAASRLLFTEGYFQFL
jgi:hypothetical protein